MSTKVNILLSGSDAVACKQIAAAMEESGVVQTVSGDTAALQRALAKAAPDAVVLGAPGTSLLERARAIRTQSADIPILVCVHELRISDPLVSPAVANHGASFVSLGESTSASGELEANSKRALLNRLRVLLGSSRAKPAAQAAAKVPNASQARTPLPSRSVLPKNRPEACVVAASTGGPKALEELLGSLPAKLPLPVLIVQHMPAGFIAGLAARLNKISGLEVKVAEDGERLAAATVYFASGDVHLTVVREKNQLLLRFDDRPPVHSRRPAADVLFESACEATKGKLVAVVLSGLGKDSIDGCKRIHESGGHVFIQDEASSTVWAVPSAVKAAGVANEVCNPRTIASRLAERLGLAPVSLSATPLSRPKPAPVASGQPAPKITPRAGSLDSQELLPEDFAFICSFMKEKTAIILEDSKVYLVKSRLSPLARQAGMGSISELIQELRKSQRGTLADSVVEAMTTNETTFFRDQTPFRLITDVLIPEYLTRAGEDRKLRIWCAASSTGQEPYSIAMTLLDAIPDIDAWDIKILASDISNDVLDQARAGAYNQVEVGRGLPASTMVKYFEKRGLTWVLTERVRNMVQFERVNLISSWPALEPLDMLLMRNVLIYFDKLTKKRLLDRARKLLKPEGVLFLGGSETILDEADGFDQESRAGGGVFKRAA